MSFSEEIKRAGTEMLSYAERFCEGSQCRILNSK